MSNRSRLWQWASLPRLALYVGAPLVGLFGFVGYAHTESGQALLRLLPSMGSACPLGYDKSLDAVARDQIRSQSLASLRGRDRAQSNHALGLKLDETQHHDVQTWVTTHGLNCTPGPTTATLACHHVPSSALGGAPAADSVYLRFNADGYLVGVDAHRNLDQADAAFAVVDERQRWLTANIGAPSRVSGETTARGLAQGRLSQRAIEFRFVDLRARLTGTHLGRTRYLVRETYQSLTAAEPPAV